VSLLDCMIKQAHNVKISKLFYTISFE